MNDKSVLGEGKSLLERAPLSGRGPAANNSWIPWNIYPFCPTRFFTIVNVRLVPLYSEVTKSYPKGNDDIVFSID